jgi:hypothetical protein
MRKPNTYFEQVPLKVIAKVIGLEEKQKKPAGIIRRRAPAIPKVAKEVSVKKGGKS